MLYEVLLTLLLFLFVYFILVYLDIQLTFFKSYVLYLVKWEVWLTLLIWNYEVGPLLIYLFWFYFIFVLPERSF